MAAAPLKKKRTKRLPHFSRVEKPSGAFDRIIFWGRSFRWEMLLIITALICDGCSWGHQFVLDDPSYIVGNSFIHNPKNLLRIFILPLVPVPLGGGHFYRPLTALSLGLNCWIHGMNPDGFHLVNRLLHVMICVVAFSVLRHLLPNATAAFLTALLFAAHPIQTEAVTYIEGRSDLLAMLFFVLAWLFHIRARQSVKPNKSTFAVALGFYFFAMLSKENGITWIAVVLITELVYFSKRDLGTLWQNLRKGLWRPFAGYLIAPLVFLALRAYALSHVQRVHGLITNNPLSHVPFKVRELNALKILFQSLCLLLWPARFSVDYSYNQIPLTSHWTNPTGLIIIAMSLLSLFFVGWSYFRAPDLFFGASYFLITYSIVSNLVIHIGTNRADRLLYMPSLGIFLIIGILLAGLDRQLHNPFTNRVFRLGLVVLVALLVARTIWRNRDWQDDMTLSFRTVQTSPNSSNAHRYLGEAYFAHGEYGLALEQYRIAESIYAENPALLCDLGIVLYRLGNSEEAIKYYRRAIDLAPLFPAIRFYLALALRARGDLVGAELQDEAIIAFYDDLIRKNPSNADHHYFKAMALSSLGKLEQALYEYQRTLQIDPNYSGIRERIDEIKQKLQGASISQ